MATAVASGFSRTALAALVLTVGVSGAPAQEPRPLDSALRDRVKEGIDVALTYLRWRQAPDGSWGGDAEATALVLRAFVDSHRKYREDDGPFIRRPIAFLIGQLTPAGSVGGGPHAEVATAATVLALASVDRARYADAIARGRQWLRSRIADIGSSRTYAAALILEAAGSGPLPAASGKEEVLGPSDASGTDELLRLAAQTRALYATGQPGLIGAADRVRERRSELATRLLALQGSNGGWGSDVDTAIALDALELLYNRPL